MQKPFYKTGWFWTLVVITIIVIVAIVGFMSFRSKVDTAISEATNSLQQAYESTTNTNSTNQNNSSSGNVGLGETFSYDGLSLTLLPSYSFTVLQNEFSADNGKTILVLPITVKNDSSESTNLNMYAYEVYGPAGTQLSSESAYFQEESVDFAGKLQPGASYTKNIYVPFEGNGTYKIEFGLLNTDVTAEFEITQ